MQWMAIAASTSETKTFGRAQLPAVNQTGPDRGDVKITNVRIRKLTCQPPPPDVDDDVEVQNLDEYATYYERELEFDPDDPWSKFYLGAIYHDQRRYADIPKLLEPALNDVPLLKHHAARALIANSYEELGRYADADHWYAQQIQDTPNEINTLWLLARFRSTCPDKKYRNGQQALDLSDRACQSNSKQRWEPYWARATALAEAGQFDQALTAIDQAISLAPTRRHEPLNAVRSDLAAQKPSRRAPRK